MIPAFLPVFLSGDRRTVLFKNRYMINPVMSNQIYPEFWQAIEQFNQQDFYSCHDTLEALWMEAPEPEKRFYQGVLQIAVSLYHLSNHNWQGSAILLGEGISRLRNYQPIYFEINVEKLLQDSANLLSELHRVGPENVTNLAEQLFGEMSKISGKETDGLQLPRISKVS